ncbi:MAG: hypothetical protein KKF41_09880 [Actinobacteria bacterium]|nr:hypothetical protein [Actinomycetota bacterium]MBU1945095.1 hypothetical protein [Actinomycetota bacterium]MBU2687883.1 hypothetical protein [Actinomycetota bacterium]
MNGTDRMFSVEDVGVIGSYSSFLALLLIATLLAYRHIFDYGLELLRKGESGAGVAVAVYLLLAVFDLLFIVVPAIPIASSTRRAFQRRRRPLGLVLIFISTVYVFALSSQFIYMALEKKLPL